MSLCVKKGDKYVWREIYQEAGGVSRKWIFKPNDGYLPGNEIKFRLVFLDNSTFYDSIYFKGQKQYFGSNSFGKGSSDNCEDVGKIAEHGDLVTPVTNIDELIVPKKDEQTNEDKLEKDNKSKAELVSVATLLLMTNTVAPSKKISVSDASWMKEGKFCEATCKMFRYD